MHHLIKRLTLATAITTICLSAAPSAWSQTAPGLTKKILQMERDREKEFEDYFEEDLASVNKTADDTAQELARLSQATETQSALLYVIPRQTHLHLVLITPNGTPIVKDLYEVTDPLLFKTARSFHRSILRLDNQSAQEAGLKLHSWIISPFEKELSDANIDLILFCLGDGIKDLALPALYDGNQYLIETYAISRIPAFNLIDTQYRPFKSGSLLAMGASHFQNKQVPPLPGSKREIQALESSLKSSKQTSFWTVERLENRFFTLASINTQLKTTRHSALHIATHAKFQPGEAKASYLQLWDKKLRLTDLNDVDWDASKADLIVLSACQTAIGDTNAANGFAGIALKAGVPSAIGTLWSINDRFSPKLMKNFYASLPQSRTKAQALQTAQRLILDNTLKGKQSAPYYWAGFSLISSPW